MEAKSGTKDPDVLVANASQNFTRCLHLISLTSWSAVNFSWQYWMTTWCRSPRDKNTAPRPTDDVNVKTGPNFLKRDVKMRGC